MANSDISPEEKVKLTIEVLISQKGEGLRGEIVGKFEDFVPGDALRTCFERHCPGYDPYDKMKNKKPYFYKTERDGGIYWGLKDYSPGKTVWDYLGLEFKSRPDGFDPKIDKEGYKQSLKELRESYYSKFDTIYLIYREGGVASCSDLAKNYSWLGNSDDFRGNGADIGKEIARNLGRYDELFPGRKDRPFASVLFLGAEWNRHFVWKLRPALKEAIEELDREGFFDELWKTIEDKHVSVSEDGNSANNGKGSGNTMCEDKNIILYGPPGTGKTYNSVVYAVRLCEGKSLEQIEDEIKAGTDYIACRDKYNVLLKEDRITFTTFHQSYGYEEFIEGIKPSIPKEGKNEKPILEKANDGVIPDEEMDGNVVSSPDMETPHADESNLRFDYVDGIFKQFCKKAREAKDKDGKNIPAYVFIIDEINRGNISKVFGELITLIEPSKRYGESEAMSAVLPYSKDDFDVPNNVYILGTMNTADRSLALLDTALRRRFDFIEMMPRPELLKGKTVEEKGKKLDLGQMFKAINDRIEYLYDREHTIGHAFFMPLCENPTISVLSKIFKNKIIPLLQEYFYDDYEKIRLVLGDNAIDNEDFQFVREVRKDRNEIFVGSPDLEDKTLYEINEKALSRIESYVSIYDPKLNTLKQPAGGESDGAESENEDNPDDNP